MAVQRSRRRSPICADPNGVREARIAAGRRLLLASAAALLMIFTPPCAVGDVTDADLQAGARALGFLDSLPHDGIVAVGIVYADAVSESKAQAQQTADRLRMIPGPNNSRFVPVLIPVETLSRTSERVDVLYLMPGVSGSAATIAEVARQRHLLTLSDDPACVDSHDCVLMVRSDRRVEIVLDIALADAVGVHFPSVFMMLVTRK
ncbi:MAG: YfiR/HmsC family protein [Aliidongia sp.]